MLESGVNNICFRKIKSVLCRLVYIVYGAHYIILCFPVCTAMKFEQKYESEYDYFLGEFNETRNGGPTYSLLFLCFCKIYASPIKSEYLEIVKTRIIYNKIYNINSTEN